MPQMAFVLFKKSMGVGQMGTKMCFVHFPKFQLNAQHLIKVLFKSMQIIIVSEILQKNTDCKILS